MYSSANLPDGQANYESGAISWRAFSGNVAVVPFNDLPAGRQPDARTLVLVSAMQPLKDAENLV